MAGSPRGTPQSPGKAGKRPVERIKTRCTAADTRATQGLRYPSPRVRHRSWHPQIDDIGD